MGMISYVGLIWSLLNRKPIFEWFVVTNGHLKEMLYNEIGICAQSIVTIPGSIFHTFARAYVIFFKEKENLQFDLL